MLTIEKDLDMSPEVITPVTISVRQYDTAVTVLFKLFVSTDADFSIPEGTTALVRGMRPRSGGILKEVDIEDGTVTVPLDEQMTAVDGRGLYEVSLVNEGDILSSQTFNLNVIRAEVAEDSEITVVEIPDFVSIMAQLAELQAAVETVLARVEDVEEAEAEITAMVAEFQASVTEAMSTIESESTEAQEAYEAVLAQADQISASATAALADIETARQEALEDLGGGLSALSNTEIEAIMS